MSVHTEQNLTDNDARIDGAPRNTDLLERLRAATGPNRELDAAIYNAMEEDGGRIAFRVSNWTRGCAPMLERYHDGWLSGKDEDDIYANTLIRYTASLDAALALVDRVLSGRNIEIATFAALGEAMARIALPGDPLGSLAQAPTAPLAVLVALLDALSDGAPTRQDGQLRDEP
jgi:hypothetical protein